MVDRSPSPEAQTPSPSPSAVTKDAKAACGIVFDGGDASIAFRIPGALTDVQAELSGERLDEMLEINTELVKAIEQAPPAMVATLRSLQVPFQQVQDVVDAGGGQLNMDTSGVASDVTALMGQCVDEGFTVS